ncbi:MAG: glutamate--tRNA ligase family protein [Candidatus Taylorbacteria bacterium]
MTNKPVVTRFAPSPTGFLHVGGARSALFNYLYARQNDGKILLRIEDTDKERNKPEYTQGIISAFTWLGIEFDGTVIQSDNFTVHKTYLEKLIASGHAYISKEKVVEEGQRAEVIRFKNPNTKIVFEDLIKGSVEFDTTELGDFIIAKSLDEPIFHLSNVVDDITMGITHVIRGEEHISNTPRQILIWEAIGEKPRPIYGHIPLLLADNREKISKRKHGEMVAVEYYEKLGYMPQALLNFLVLLGWNPGDNTEMISLDQMIKEFNIAKVQKAGAIFNVEKLQWFNRQYISKLTDKQFIEGAKSFIPKWLDIDGEIFSRMMPLIREKISVFCEISELFGIDIVGTVGELNFVNNLQIYPSQKLLWKKAPDREVTKSHLVECRKMIRELAGKSPTIEIIKSAIWPYAEAHGKGDVLWPLRMSLTGQEKSPDPFTCLYILGIDESLKRIDAAILSLNS